MKVSGLAIPKNKTELTLFIIKWGLRASSVAHIFDAASSLKLGKYGEGLINAAICMLFLLVASGDLEKLWNSRNMSPLAAALADPPSLKFMTGAILFYFLFIAGIVIQFFE